MSTTAQETRSGRDQVDESPGGRCLLIEIAAMNDGPDQPPETLVSGKPPRARTETPPLARDPFFRRIDWLSCGITAIAAFTLYVSTLAPEVTLRYSGINATSALYGGTTCPLGFPVWTMYSWALVKLLPFSNIAWRVAVGSARLMVAVISSPRL
jgi:hypothetical protein